MNGQNLVVVEILEDTFKSLVERGHLLMDDVILVEVHKAGMPEYTANLKLMSQIQKDATTAYREAMKKIDVLKIANQKLDDEI